MAFLLNWQYNLKYKIILTFQYSSLIYSKVKQGSFKQNNVCVI